MPPIVRPPANEAGRQAEDCGGVVAPATQGSKSVAGPQSHVREPSRRAMNLKKATGPRSRSRGPFSLRGPRPAASSSLVGEHPRSPRRADPAEVLVRQEPSEPAADRSEQSSGEEDP